MKDWNEYGKSLNTIGYYVYALCEIKDRRRLPFYIGKGQKGRCLQHLSENGESEKNKKIAKLLKEDRLGIDILRHSLPNDSTARLIESTCIDLLGVGELSNVVRGSGTEMGRATLEEIHNLQSGEIVKVDPEHKGLAFLLNTSYKSGMSDLELFEVTRGIWIKVPRDEDIKYAYATYGGLVKEVYEIHSWVKAGTQQYFSRELEEDRASRSWEFVGRKAPEEIRKLYVGKVLDKKRSHGTPFVRVGFE